jgi:acetyl-CoA carboxylase carboxyl transferase subunit alpha
MQSDYLDFEHPLETLDASETGTDTQRHNLLKKLYQNLSPYQQLMLARHRDRPHFKDYLQTLFKNIIPLSGDRVTGRCPATLALMAEFEDQPVIVIGHQKGRSLQSRINHQYGMPNPCGYRMALRAFKLAEKYQIPILTFIDTPGAYPGIDAEIQNQSSAISENIMYLSTVKTPVINTIIGEGMSGGALGIGVGDHMLMLENSVFSVISPEGCAAILWNDASMKEKTAQLMQINATSLLKHGLIDQIIPEGKYHAAHVDWEGTFEQTKTHIRQTLKTLCDQPIKTTLAKRQKKLYQYGSLLSR